MKEKEFEKFLQRHLELFDELPKDDVVSRRTLCKPLFDYYMWLMFVIGTNLCSIDRRSLRVCHLKTRWENLKVCLKYVCEPDEWDETINKLNKIRSKVEHNDGYDPSLNRLKEIRDKAPEFGVWIRKVGKEYYKESKNFTLAEAFKVTVRRNISKARRLQNDYKGKIETGGVECEWYDELLVLEKQLIERLEHIRKADDIEHSDIDKLVSFVEFISFFEGREYILLERNVCPKCGGKITETQNEVAGPPGEPPISVKVRVGCENCDYVLASETFDISL